MRILFDLWALLESLKHARSQPLSLQLYSLDLGQTLQLHLLSYKMQMIARKREKGMCGWPVQCSYSAAALPNGEHICEVLQGCQRRPFLCKHS